MNLNNTLDDIEYFYRVYGQELIPVEPEWSELTEAQRNAFARLRNASIEYGNE